MDDEPIDIQLRRLGLSGIQAGDHSAIARDVAELKAAAIRVRSALRAEDEPSNIFRPNLIQEAR
jgi:hypothetical protein